MITANILSGNSFELLDIIQIKTYEITENINFSGTSKIETYRKPIIEENSIIALKDGGKQFYIGVCQNIKNENGEEGHEIEIAQIEKIFDRDIILEGEELIASTGIEDFINNVIVKNFISSDDEMINLPYIKATAATHTKTKEKVDAKEGIFNLLSYMENATIYHGIIFSFFARDKKLEIVMEKKEQKELKIDAGVKDVINYEETYKVDVLAKLTVLWKVPDKEENNITTVGKTTVLNYFLLTDRTISKEIGNPNRTKGKIETICVEKETIEEAEEEAQNKFKGDSYEHCVEADIKKGSKLYPQDLLYIGKQVVIKTKSNGIKDSIITKIDLKNEDDYIHIKFGNMAITLLEKLRKEKQ